MMILLNFIYGEKEIAKIDKKIHQIGEGSDSPGNFGCKRTGKINQRVILKTTCK